MRKCNEISTKKLFIKKQRLVSIIGIDSEMKKIIRSFSGILKKECA